MKMFMEMLLCPPYGRKTMKCFNHEKIDAVGVCRSCGRGLCRDCIAEVGLSCSCKGECEEVVATMNDLVERGRTSYQKISGAQLRFGIVFGLVGVILLVFAGVSFADAQSGTGYYLLALAIPLLVLGALMIYAAKRLREK
jgi:hypothetical protein